jgi:hypothetical protein
MSSNSQKIYKIWHNGYDVQILATSEEVEKFINSIIEQHRNLNPTKIMDRTFKGNGTKQTRIIRYRYTTLYEEDFIIDISNC